MRAFVTGATGFIGSELVKQLSNLGFSVRVLVRPQASLDGIASHFCEKVVGDLFSYDVLKKSLREVDYVFHLAGRVSGTPRQFFETNTRGTYALLRAMEQSGGHVKRFVLVSSLAASGPASCAHSPKTEGDLDQPVSAYGESKLRAEHLLLKKTAQVPSVVIRPPIVYGPRDRGFFSMIQLLSKRLAPKFASRKKGISKHYSVIHVTDLCRGLVQAALKKDLASGELFYLAEEKVYTYDELLEGMSRALGRKAFRFSIPPWVLPVGARMSDWAQKWFKKSFPLTMDKVKEIQEDFWTCSCQKAKKVLDFQIEYDFFQGIDQTTQWYRKQKWLV